MGRKYWTSFMYAMGLLAVAFTALSLIFPSVIQIRFLHLAVCVVVPVHLFSFLTLELKLFSSYLWVRRWIVILFSILVMIAINFAFGYLRWELNRFLIVFAISMVVFILLTVFAYYLADKIEKQYLKAINQKLADRIAKNEE